MLPKEQTSIWLLIVRNTLWGTFETQVAFRVVSMKKQIIDCLVSRPYMKPGEVGLTTDRFSQTFYTTMYIPPSIS
jgi:hypothetical protein